MSYFICAYYTSAHLKYIQLDVVIFLAVIRHLTGWCISQHMSKLDIVDISYACVFVRVCLACVFMHVRMCVCVCVRVYAFTYHEMCVNSSKKAKLHVKEHFLTFH